MSLFQNASIDDDDDWADFGGFEVKLPLSKGQIIHAIDQNKTVLLQEFRPLPLYSE